MGSNSIDNKIHTNNVDYSHVKFQGEKKEEVKVAAGNLENDQLKINYKKEALDLGIKMTSTAPLLETANQPSLTKTTEAKKNVDQLTDMSTKVTEQLSSVLQNSNAGTLTNDQKKMIMDRANVLDRSSLFLNTLKDESKPSADGLKSVLLHIGLTDKQAKNILLLVDDKNVNENTTLKNKLQSLGYTDSQLNILLALAPKIPESSIELSSNPQMVLTQLGFTNEQSNRMLLLLDSNNPSLSNDEMISFLDKMGVSSDQSSLLSAYVDPERIEQFMGYQKTFSTENNLGLSSVFKDASRSMHLLAEGKPLNTSMAKTTVDIMAIMELLFQVNVERRKSAREFRAVEYNAAHQQILKQADEMKKSAEQTRYAGHASGAAKIGSAGLQIAGASGVLSKAKVPQGADASAQANAQSSATQSSIARGNAFGQIVSGVGDAASSELNFQAARHQAQQKIHEAEQRAYDNAAQSDSEFMQLHQEMLRNAQSKLEEVIRGTHESLKTITRG